MCTTNYLLVTIISISTLSSILPVNSIGDDENSYGLDLETSNSDTNKLKQNAQYSDFRNLHLDKQDSELPKTSENASNEPHSRQKRLIWVTDDGRLALPPGTSLTISPTLALPFVRYPPDGFFSNISISLPVTLDFDKLGLTDNQNPLGVLPPVFARQMGRAAGSLLADYVGQYLTARSRKRSRRETQSSYFHIESNSIEDEEVELPKLPDTHQHAFHGGERALLYVVLEDFLQTFGLDGKACLLRAICEIHSKSLPNFGFFGEILKLFFTASLSPYSHLMDEYVSAEKIGKGEISPGECFPYYKECPKSLFKTGAHKYRKKKESSGKEEEDLKAM